MKNRTVVFQKKKIKKSNKGRKGASTTNNLAKAKIVIDLTDEEKICPNCGSQMKKAYTVTSERIVHIPAQEYIEVVVRNVYECPNCVDENDKPVTKAAQDKQIIERSIATPSLLAHVFMSKYQRHTPFYCQEDTYNWQGLHISRQPKRNTGMTGSAGKKKPKTAMIQNAICGSCEAEENIPYTHIISDGLDAVRTYFRFSKFLPEM